MGTFLVKHPNQKASIENGTIDDARNILLKEGGDSSILHFFLNADDAYEDVKKGMCFVLLIHSNMGQTSLLPNFNTYLPSLPHVYGSCCFVRFQSDVNGEYFFGDVTEHDIRRASALIERGIDIDYHDPASEFYDGNSSDGAELLHATFMSSEQCNCQFSHIAHNIGYMKASFASFPQKNEKVILLFGKAIAQALEECLYASPYAKQNIPSEKSYELPSEREYSVSLERLSMRFDLNFHLSLLFADFYCPVFDAVLENDDEFPMEFGHRIDSAIYSIR